MKQLFLLEDDETLGRGIALALEEPDRAVFRAGTLNSAREALAHRRFDLMILDINLPRRQRAGPAPAASRSR